jgi:hypothetical protein
MLITEEVTKEIGDAMSNRWMVPVALTLIVAGCSSSNAIQVDQRSYQA